MPTVESLTDKLRDNALRVRQENASEQADTAPADAIATPDDKKEAGADPAEAIAIISAEVGKVPGLAVLIDDPKRYDKLGGRYCGKYQAVHIMLEMPDNPIAVCEFRLAVGIQNYDGFSADRVNLVSPEMVQAHIKAAVLQMLNGSYEFTIPDNITSPLFDSNTGRPLADGEKAPVTMGYETHSQVTGLPMSNVGSGMVQMGKDGRFLTVTSAEAALLAQQGWEWGAVAKGPIAQIPQRTEEEMVMLRQTLASLSTAEFD